MMNLSHFFYGLSSIVAPMLASGLMSVGGWLVNFLEKAYKWDTVSASGMLSAFFLCFSLGRLLLGPITDRIGFNLSLIIFSGFSAVCTFIATWGGESLAFLFAAAGLGISMIYPTELKRKQVCCADSKLDTDLSDCVRSSALSLAVYCIDI